MAMITDMLFDKYKMLHYITITVHYITKNWCLEKYVLHIVQWSLTEKKNSIRTFSTNFEYTKSQNANELMNKLTFVTD